MINAQVLDRVRQEIVALPESADRPMNFECPACQDSGFITTITETSRSARQCECLRRKGLARRTRNAGIPQRYAEATFDSFRTAGADQTVVMGHRLLRHAVEEFLLHPRGQGYLLTGPCGVGKTHLAAAALREVMTRYGVKGKFWDVADLLTEVKASFRRSARNDEEPGEAELVQEFATVDVLVVDEIGGERGTDWSFDEVALLLNKRYNACGQRPTLTILTTNLPNLGAGEGRNGATTLGDRIGARMFSRLQEMCRPIDMQGADYRRKR